jgi:hypothetical protein
MTSFGSRVTRRQVLSSIATAGAAAALPRHLSAAPGAPASGRLSRFQDVGPTSFMNWEAMEGTPH